MNKTIKVPVKWFESLIKQVENLNDSDYVTYEHEKVVMLLEHIQSVKLLNK
jgi:hypothetical protein